MSDCKSRFTNDKRTFGKSTHVATQTCTEHHTNHYFFLYLTHCISELNKSECGYGSMCNYQMHVGTAGTTREAETERLTTQKTRWMFGISYA